MRGGLALACKRGLTAHAETVDQGGAGLGLVYFSWTDLQLLTPLHQPRHLWGLSWARGWGSFPGESQSSKMLKCEAAPEQSPGATFCYHCLHPFLMQV